MKSYLLPLLFFVVPILAMNNEKIITLDQIVSKIEDATKGNKYNKTQKWFTRLQLTASADWKYFTQDQVEKYTEIYVKLSDQVEDLKPPKTKRRKISDDLQKVLSQTNKEALWLANKIEKDQFIIDWSTLLGGTVNYPESSEQLKNHRINKLNETGQIKRMN